MSVPTIGSLRSQKVRREMHSFFPRVVRGQVLFGRSAGGSFSEAKKNSMRRMVQMAVAIAAVVASTQTEEGGPCAGTHGPQVRSRAPTHRLSYAACACGVRRSAQGARGRLLHSGRAAWSDVPPRQRLSRPPTGSRRSVALWAPEWSVGFVRHNAALQPLRGVAQTQDSLPLYHPGGTTDL